MSYVDGFLIPLATDKLEAYRQMAESAGKIWMEHGALAYKECVGDDLNPAMPAPNAKFPQLAGAKEGEDVIFAFIVYKDRAHRDEVNAKVMADPRIKDSCPEGIFDFTRMAYGGFKAIVDF